MCILLQFDVQRLYVYGRVYIFIKDLFCCVFQVPGEQLVKQGRKHLRSMRTKPTHDPNSFTQIHHPSSHTHHLSSKYINKTPNHSSLVTYSPNHTTSSPSHLTASPHHIKYSPCHLNSLPPNLSSSAFRQNSRHLNTLQFHVDFAPLDDKVSPIRPNITYNKTFQFREENYYKLYIFT